MLGSSFFSDKTLGLWQKFPLNQHCLLCLMCGKSALTVQSQVRSDSHAHLPTDTYPIQKGDVNTRSEGTELGVAGDVSAGCLPSSPRKRAH